MEDIEQPTPDAIQMVSRLQNHEPDNPDLIPVRLHGDTPPITVYAREPQPG